MSSPSPLIRVRILRTCHGQPYYTHRDYRGARGRPGGLFHRKADLTQHNKSIHSQKSFDCRNIKGLKEIHQAGPLSRTPTRLPLGGHSQTAFREVIALAKLVGDFQSHVATGLCVARAFPDSSASSLRSFISSTFLRSALAYAAARAETYGNALQLVSFRGHEKVVVLDVNTQGGKAFATTYG